MTTHHNIHLAKTKTDLKLTYRNGRFKKLEHLRGVLDQQMLDALGKIVPRLENDLEDFKLKYQNKVVYTNLSTTKTISIYSQFNSAWYAFFSKENNGRKPKFTGADGKALNQIIEYLSDEHNGDEAVAFAVWNFILDNWKHIPEFYRDQHDLKIINSKLNLILRTLENKHISNERTFEAAANSEAGRAFKFGGNG